jgi:acetylornithine/succinyldiaminopimelate/putrescine aminotransferase
MLLEIERAEGVYLFSPEGKAILDFNSGISVSSVGHNQPSVVRAVKEQAGSYMHTMVYGEHIQTPQVELAKALTDLLPPDLDTVYFVNSGSEAIEGAMKLAKRVTGQPDMVAARHAYHGSSHGAESLRSDIEFTYAFRPAVPGIKHIDFNKIEDLEKIDKRTAGVVIEVVQAEAGVIPARKEFLTALRKRCDETGTLLIFDEIQTGCGRTGKHFAFQNYGVVPDVICLAKALGGGMPLGAFISSADNMKTLIDNPALGHITTFGGHPVSCAAALAALKIWSSTEVLDNVKKVHHLMNEKIRHEDIQAVRSYGLMFAVDLGDEDRVQHIYKKCLDKGVMLDWFLFNWESVRIAPPLIISEEDALKGVQILLEAIEDTR